MSPRDIHNIIKVASTEVVSGLNRRDLYLQTAGVVDTILNRAASGRWGKKGDVTSVVNAKWQFSKISGLASAYGSVERMPDAKINPLVAQTVMRHLQNRMNGAPSSVGDHLHYANPYESSAYSQAWVQPVAIRARQQGLVYGSGRAIHVHGTEPSFNRSRPGKFNIEML